MRAVVQRVSQASVTIDGTVVATIGTGLLVLLGVHHNDSETDSRRLAEKIINLRIFVDQNGKMNRSLRDLGGELLVVSQFTLYADCRKGRRPGYADAAPPERAEPLYHHFIESTRAFGIKTATGRFQATMQVTLTNDGPVTVLLDTDTGLSPPPTTHLLSTS